MVSYENGKIPASILRRVSNFVPLYPGVTSDAGSDLLREDAWAALNMLQLAFYKGFERPLNVSEAYRGRTRQTATWQSYLAGGTYAAPVGTSPHGWALAVDFGSGVATYGTATKYWMDRNAPRWGWHPTGNGFPKREAWHFEFRPGTATEIIPASSGGTPIPSTPTEDTLSAAEVSQINAYTEASQQATRQYLAERLAQSTTAILDYVEAAHQATRSKVTEDALAVEAYDEQAHLVTRQLIREEVAKITKPGA